jgi:urease accessory protein
MEGTPTADDQRMGMTTGSLLRLCHLVSPALPVGAYAYSQGLEYAVHAGWVCHEDSALEWITGLSQRAVGSLDLPILWRLYRAWEARDLDRVEHWNVQLIAARETAELRAEERHLGQALLRVLPQLDLPEARDWSGKDPAFLTLFSLAAVRWQIPATATLSGFLWAWSENQVLAALKLVPLGQSAGQRLLNRLTHTMADTVARAQGLDDAAIGVGALAQSLGSALHETQETRLFRS